MTRDIRSLAAMGLATLPIRFVQGWIFWGGGSRRFFYDPTKLDPSAPHWMANKLQSAMPGALLGTSEAISYLLQHFDLLYTSIILFSLLELLCGLGLLIGFLTRFCGMASVFISAILMLTFGWQGATCIDEWTMAVATLSMGMTLWLSGAPIYSVDAWLNKRYPLFVESKWVPYIRIHEPKRSKAMVLLFATIAFTLVTYNYYRGSIYSHYHKGPTGNTLHHLQLKNLTISQDGAVNFRLYVNAGTPALPSNIIRIELLNTKTRTVLEAWTGKQLSHLPQSAIDNQYLYNQIHTGPYGLVAPLSAKASITLKAEGNVTAKGKDASIVLYTINGEKFNSSESNL